MKMFFTSLFCVLSIAGFCQMRTFYALTDFDNVWKAKDTVSSLIAPKYKFEKIDSGTTFVERKPIIFYWVDSAGNEITLSFLRVVTVRNLDLGVTGKYVIGAGKMMGPYMDIFPLWASIWDQQAELIKTQAAGNVNVGKIDLNSSYYVFPNFKSIRPPVWMIEAKALPPI